MGQQEIGAGRQDNRSLSLTPEFYLDPRVVLAVLKFLGMSDQIS